MSIENLIEDLQDEAPEGRAYHGDALKEQSPEPRPAPFKACTCCERGYSKGQWKSLPLCGASVDLGRVLEMRNCLTCGSTLACALDPSIREQWLEATGVLQELLDKGKGLVEQTREAIEKATWFEDATSRLKLVKL